MDPALAKKVLTVYLKHPIGILQVGQSKSGLTRHYYVIGTGELGGMESITHLVGKACGFRLKEVQGHWVISINGYGFNGQQEIADHLSRLGLGPILWNEI
jgi:hypothetical protein